MYMMTNFGELYRVTRITKNEYAVEAYQRSRWNYFGKYEKSRITTALDERTLQKCSKLKAEKYMRIQQQQQEQLHKISEQMLSNQKITKIW